MRFGKKDNRLETSVSVACATFLGFAMGGSVLSVKHPLTGHHFFCIADRHGIPVLIMSPKGTGQQLSPRLRFLVLVNSTMCSNEYVQAMQMYARTVGIDGRVKLVL